MEYSLFYEIALVLLVAGVIAILISWLKQPSVLAYILTGVIVGPLGYYRLQQSHSLEALGQIGIAMLLFMVGLELDFKRVKQLGKTALLTGVGQILVAVIIGFFVAKALGFSNIAGLYIAVALSFSSTIIVVKLLTEKKDMQSLYARICVGFLIVQDFAAMGILLFLGGSGTQGDFFGIPGWQMFIFTLVKALFLFLILFYLSNKIFPRLLLRLGKSEDLLLIFSVAWALGLAAFASLPWVGFSIEIGAFLAGLALANSQVHFEIQAKIRPIRDLFIILFFIVFGANLGLGSLGHFVWPALIFSAVVLIINPLSVFLIMSFLGYKPRTSFFASVTVAQISEFSFILVVLGRKLGHVSDEVLGMVTLVGLVTITASSYMILHTRKIFEYFRPLLVKFDFKKGSAEHKFGDLVLKNHVVLIGVNRLGSHLINSLDKSSLVVVDFDPEVAQKFSEAGFVTICGDITDPFIQEQANLKDAKLIISTVPDFEDNLALLDGVKKLSKKGKVKSKLIFAAQNEQEARLMYEKEIDYALSPHFISGTHLSHILEKDFNLNNLKKLKKQHLQVLGK